jgi:hypothetical protein
MRRVACRPPRKSLSAAKRGDPAAPETLAEAVMPRTALVQRLCRATPTVRRQESSQQVVVGLLGAPGALPRADRPPRSLQRPVHPGARRELAAGARHSRTSP